MFRSAIKSFFFFLLLISLHSSFAGNPWHNYLVTTAATTRPHAADSLCVRNQQPVAISHSISIPFIPRYQIPKGNIFCRMEDKLTRNSGLWIKVDVK